MDLSRATARREQAIEHAGRASNQSNAVYARRPGALESANQGLIEPV